MEVSNKTSYRSKKSNQFITRRILSKKDMNDLINYFSENGLIIQINHILKNHLNDLNDNPDVIYFRILLANTKTGHINIANYMMTYYINNDNIFILQTIIPKVAFHNHLPLLKYYLSICTKKEELKSLFNNNEKSLSELLTNSLHNLEMTEFIYSLFENTITFGIINNCYNYCKHKQKQNNLSINDYSLTYEFLKQKKESYLNTLKQRLF